MSELRHEFAFPMPLPADCERAYAALVEPAQLLAWFAEHVEIEARLGGPYRFWGRHTHATQRREQATQVVTRLQPGRALGYSWTFEGVPSTVDMELEPAEQGCRFTVRHHFPEAPDQPRFRELVDDLWRMHVGNLWVHLSGGFEVVRPDFSNPKPEVRLSVLIDAPRAAVFRALLDPDTLNQWIASAASVEPRQGGALSYGWNYEVGGRQVAGGPTRILELVENQKLVTDWPDWRGDPELAPTTVTWLLEDAGTQTRVTLLHQGFQRAADISDYGFGWQDFLRRLRGVFEPAAPAAG